MFRFSKIYSKGSTCISLTSPRTLRSPSRWLAHPSHRYICFPNFARSCHSPTRLLNELPRERQTRRTNVLYVKQSVLNKSCQSDSDPQMPSLPCAHLVRTLCTSTTFAAGRFPKILASGSAPHKIGRNPLSQSSYIN